MTGGHAAAVAQQQRVGRGAQQQHERGADQRPRGDVQKVDGADLGGVESKQFSDKTGKNVYTMVAYENMDPYEAVKNMEASYDGNTEATDVSVSSALIGSYTGYMLQAYYPNDNVELYVWVYKTPEHDDYTHYLAIECTQDDYALLWLNSQSFSFEK